jgi:hypothetical protein
MSIYTVCRIVGRHLVPNNDDLKYIKEKINTWQDFNKTTDEDIMKIKELLGVPSYCKMRPDENNKLIMIISLKNNKDNLEVHLIINEEGDMRATIPWG